VRGLRRQQALEAHALWRGVEPVVRWLGLRAAAVLPGSWQRRLDGSLQRWSDPFGLSGAEFVVLSSVSFGVGLGLGVAFGPALSMGSSLALLLAPLGAALPHLAVAHAGGRRLARLRRSLPHGLQLIALAMTAGSDLHGALQHVLQSSCDSDDPLVEELGCVLRELRLGRTRRQALLGLGERVKLPEVAEFVAAAVQAEQQGTPLAEVLRTLAVAARTRRTVSAEAAASRAGVQMVAPLFLVFLAVMLLVLGPMLLSLGSDTAPGGVLG
jgi:tight adherence protein C